MLRALSITSHLIWTIASLIFLALIIGRLAEVRSYGWNDQSDDDDGRDIALVIRPDAV